MRRPRNPEGIPSFSPGLSGLRLAGLPWDCKPKIATTLKGVAPEKARPEAIAFHDLHFSAPGRGTLPPRQGQEDISPG